VRAVAVAVAVADDDADDDVDGEPMKNIHECCMSLMQEFRRGADVISAGRQILCYVTLLTIVFDVVTSSTSEATYLQYLSGTRPLN